jgi:hypothetical protein
LRIELFHWAFHERCATEGQTVTQLTPQCWWMTTARFKARRCDVKNSARRAALFRVLIIVLGFKNPLH